MFLLFLSSHSRGLIQDHVASGVKMTCKDTFLSRREFQQLLYVAVCGLPGDYLYFPPPLFFLIPILSFFRLNSPYHLVRHSPLILLQLHHFLHRSGFFPYSFPFPSFLLSSLSTFLPFYLLSLLCSFPPIMISCPSPVLLLTPANASHLISSFPTS